MDQPRPLQQFIAFWNAWNPARAQPLDSAYAPDVVFVDPFHRIEGRERLTEYFRSMEKRVSGGSLRITDVTVGTVNSAVLVWEMELVPRHRSTPIRLEGTTHLRWNESGVTYHKDFFDAAALVYDHVPVLGWLIAGVRRFV